MRAVGSTEIMVISPIDTTNEGPKVPEGAKGWQPVHLMQGSMDGACGLYSLMMGLIICGIVRYEEARSFHAFSSKSKLGKLLEYFGKMGPLINGTDLEQMFKAIDEYSPGQINCQGLMRKGYGAPALVEFIEQNIIENHPVLLLITFEGGAHWVLAIGRECESQGKKTKLCRFLILDPDENTPIICSWNGVIDARKQKGAYPYRWWRTKDINDVKVQLEYAIAIWPKKNK